MEKYPRRWSSRDSYLLPARPSASGWEPHPDWIHFKLRQPGEAVPADI